MSIATAATCPNVRIQRPIHWDTAAYFNNPLPIWSQEAFRASPRRALHLRLLRPERSHSRWLPSPPLCHSLLRLLECVAAGGSAARKTEESCGRGFDKESFPVALFISICRWRRVKMLFFAPFEGRERLPALRRPSSTAESAL